MNGGMNKIVLVTGATRGIGRAVADTLRRDGATVIAHGRSGADVVGDLAEAGGAELVWEHAIALHGRIDVLVNNAGAWLPSPVDDATAWDDGWARNLALNLVAPATLCRLAIGHFRDIGGGVIINMTSRSAHRGDNTEHLAYGAAKGGLLALTKGIARGFAAERILAYAVAPGWVATDIAEEADVAGLAATLPMREITPPADVAEVVAFLASGRSPHTTGATIDITGADYVR
jgi:NAD(P)-dependent dehydrogenase (short-subunit alcohol dehydrogenase family)